MRKLSNDELWQLEAILDDGIRYLILRDGEEPVRYLRMQFPSKVQERAAKLEEFKYKSAISAEPGIKTRRALEKENKAVLKDINNEMTVLRKKLEGLQHDFVEQSLPDLPSAKEDPDAFEAELKIKTESLQEAIDEVTLLDASKREILSFCAEELATQHYVERIVQMCWEQATDDDWEPVWASWELFENDHNQLVQLLVGETRLWTMGGVPFFASQPSQAVGGSDT